MKIYARSYLDLCSGTEAEKRSEAGRKAPQLDGRIYFHGRAHRICMCATESVSQAEKCEKSYAR